MSSSTGIDAELGYEPGESLNWSELLETPAHKRLARKRLSQFVAGPLPMAQLCVAANLPGKALAVWLLIHFRTRVLKHREVTLPAGLLESVGVDHPTTKVRVLRSLEDAGLIHVSRAAGKASRITLVEP